MTTRRSFIRRAVGAVMAVVVGAYCPGVVDAGYMPDGPFSFRQVEPCRNSTHLMVGTLNEQPWRGHRAGTVLCVGAAFECRGLDDTTHYHYMFEHRKAGYGWMFDGRQVEAYKSRHFGLLIPAPSAEQSQP